MAIYDRMADQRRGARFAERAGLDPATTSIDWSFETTGDQQILVRLETFLFLNKEEFAKLYNEKETE